jgi:hypothetical protein
MAKDNSGTPRQKIVIGTGIAAIGAYFLLVGVGALPLPSELHGPMWLVLCVGLVFLLAGVAVMVQGFGRGNEQGELAADAAPWLRAAQYLCVGVIFAAFAAIASWIAFGPGERSFSGTLPMVGAIGAFIGRAMFGLSAIVLWLCTIGMAVSGISKLIRRGKGGPA